MSLNKAILYILIILFYLGLSKGFSPREYNINYIKNYSDLEDYIEGSPVSLILVDTHSTGYLIKTYYHKYRAVYGFQTYDEIIVRTSSQFHNKLKDNIGLSIFRRDDNLKISTIALPPGSLFIGDRSFGKWVYLDSGEKVWRFYRPYRNIARYLGWENFRPNFEFYEKLKIHLSQNIRFEGLEPEFGINGSVTQKAFPKYFARKNNSQLDFKKMIKNYFKENF